MHFWDRSKGRYDLCRQRFDGISKPKWIEDVFFFWISGNVGAHVQSLMIGLVLFLFSGFLATIGVLAELISANRKMIEELLRIVRDKRDAT